MGSGEVFLDVEGVPLSLGELALLFESHRQLGVLQLGAARRLGGAHAFPVCSPLGRPEPIGLKVLVIHSDEVGSGEILLDAEGVQLNLGEHALLFESHR